jgi:hypothetical protein
MITEIKINKADLNKSALEITGKITQVFFESLKKWGEEEPIKLKGDKLFYCPICSHTTTESYYMVKKYGRPKCLACGVEMVDFDKRRFRELRQRLADEALPIVPRVVEALLEVAEAHGFTDPLIVEIHDQVLYVDPDITPNEFRYDASTKRLEAYYYYYDAPNHVESLKALIKAAWRLGLGVLVRMEPHHMKMPLPYYNLPISRPDRGIFYGYEIKMTSEELRGFARGYGGL